MGHYSWDVIGGTSLWWDTRGETTKVGHQRHFSRKPSESLLVLQLGKTLLRTREQPIPLAPVAPAGQHVASKILAAYNAWIKGSKEIVGFMLMTMKPEIQQNLEPLHAHEMLRELKTLFAKQAEQELLQTTRDFHSYRQEEGSQLARIWGTPMGKTINDLHVMLKLHEQTLLKNNALALHSIRAGKVHKGNKHKKSQSQMAARGQNHGKGKNKQAQAPKPKIPTPPKREDPAKDSIFHEYGETGHWKRNFPWYLAELLKKKKKATLGAGGSGIFVIELNTILNRSWIYDTGCGTVTPLFVKKTLCHNHGVSSK
nr:hypothetical protein [Tanacetum cinerariifolium]